MTECFTRISHRHDPGMYSGNTQHGGNGLYTLIQTADELGACSLQKELRSGKDMRSKLVLETVNRNAVPRGLSTKACNVEV